jgi:protein tyrosine phosphatase (PTP) superfamily phosphohydrolase (DUF442 family)
VRWQIAVLLIGVSFNALAGEAIVDTDVPVRNYQVISDRLGTGGTLSAGAARWLAADGYQMIIDLRDNFDETEANEALDVGAIYVHLPVSWRAPSADELETFLLVMTANPEKKILVHCSANYRASAMTYLYRVLELAADQEEAMADVLAIWEPNETWLSFIARSIDTRDSATE